MGPLSRAKQYTKTAWCLKNDTETSVTSYHSKLRKISKGRRFRTCVYIPWRRSSLEAEIFLNDNVSTICYCDKIVLRLFKNPLLFCFMLFTIMVHHKNEALHTRSTHDIYWSPIFYVTPCLSQQCIYQQMHFVIECP